MVDFGDDIENLVSKNQPTTPAGGDNPPNPPAPPAGGENPPAGGDNPPNPPAPPAGGENPPPPGLNLKDILGEEWGDVEKAKTLPTKLRELEEQAKKVVLPSYADEDTAMYDQFVRSTKIKDFGLFNKIKSFDNADTDPLETLVMKKIIDNPKLMGFEDKIREDLTKYYKVDPRLEDEDTLRYNKIKLDEDAAIAKESISSLKENISKFDPKSQEETRTQAVTQLKESWKPVIEGIDQSFKQLNAKITIGEGDKAQNIDVAIDIPANVKPQIMAEVDSFIETYNVPNTEQGQAVVKEFMESRALLLNKQAVFASIWGQAVAAATKAINSGIHNPTTGMPSTAGSEAPSGNPFVDSSKAAFAD
jgi:hypothetical protein